MEKDKSLLNCTLYNVLKICGTMAKLLTKKVLLVDDNFDFRTAIAKALEFKVHIMSVNIKSTKQNLLFKMKVKSNDKYHLAKSIDELRKIDGVFSVTLDE